MDEAQAKAWLVDEMGVSRETLVVLDDFVRFLREENQRQNLVSRSSLGQVWERHIVDSAQLLLFAPADARTWLDLGTGAGFPGLIVAMLRRTNITLVEERKLRCSFLNQAIIRLDLSAHAAVQCTPVEQLEAYSYEVITARAFAPLEQLLTLGARFATPNTRWVLPKGRNAKSELEAAESSWQGDFRLEPSVTDPEAGIIVAERVRRKGKGKTFR